MNDSGIRIEELEGGALWRITLATPKANILDAAKIAAISAAFERARAATDLKAVVIDADGPHFSFGASVEEHLPGQVEAMIPAFGQLFRNMLAAPVTTLAAVRGQCLGGGLELASFCDRVLAAPNAKLGQPEIVLGVFAPVASLVLPERCGRARGAELCISGRTVGATEAEAIGLADAVADDPAAAAIAWVEQHLLPRSASSLRFAVRAARTGFADRFLDGLERVEHLYLDELMATADAREGIEAFVAKRTAVWRNA